MAEATSTARPDHEVNPTSATNRRRGARNRLLRLLVTVPLVGACYSASPSPTTTPATSVAAPDIGKRAVAANGMVSSAHPRASEAGVEMLRRGGNAIDAAVATAFTVAVGEPQMSGLGGGGGMLIWLQEERRAEYIDFYSAQRVASWRDLDPLAEDESSLRGVAIPGEVAGLLEAHERHGNLPRAEVLEPAIRLAEEGFPVNQILADMIAGSAEKLERHSASRALLWRDDEPLQPGDILRNPELAEALRRIADEGSRGFYEGETAREVVRVLAEGDHPSGLGDLAAYEPQWKRPLCGEYKGHVVLSAPPPQTGIQLVHTLNLLEAQDLGALGYPTQSPGAFDVLTSAIRVANTDSRVNSDPNWAPVPAAGVTSEAFGDERASLVGTGRAMEEIPEGPDPLEYEDAGPTEACRALDPYGPASASASAVPAGKASPSTASAPAISAPASSGGETTHMSVVDGDGNAVALTKTNSSVWGSGASVSGFCLNNSGIDLSRAAGEDLVDGRHPWRIRNSTIAPTIVLRDGRAQVVVGAPGGGRIQPAILQSIVYIVDYGLDPLDALRMPRIYPSGGETRVETENGFSPTVLAEARNMGYTPTADAAGYARVYVIARRGDRWVGAADPRHNGEVRGY